MIVAFDTETSDLPKDWNAPASGGKNWPRIVQIAWVVCDDDESYGSPEVRLIKPDGFRITAGAFNTHGISTEQASRNGVPLLPVLNEFLEAVRPAHSVVAHNVGFDSRVVDSEFIRAGINGRLAPDTLRCTMKESTDFCRIPGPRGFKWPTMTELHNKLFNSGFDDAHDAGADCEACLRCFLKLRELHAIR